MSEVTYLYIGSYTTNIPLEDLKMNLEKIRKIGITKDPEKRQVNLTKDYLNFQYIRLWEINNVNVERKIHAILGNERIDNTEWFFDQNNDDNLVDRVSKFMSIEGHKEKTLSSEEYSINVEENKSAQLRENVHLLENETFIHTARGKKLSVTIKKDDNDKIVFYSNSLDENRNTFHKAFTDSFYFLNEKEDSNLKSLTLNAWAHPKNKDNKTPYQVIEERMQK